MTPTHPLLESGSAERTKTVSPISYISSVLLASFPSISSESTYSVSIKYTCMVESKGPSKAILSLLN